MYIEILLLAYIIDAIFSEFQQVKYLKHPIVLMGNYISWFEKKFYKDTILIGFLLTISLIFITFIISFSLSLIDNILFQALLASFTISSKMLYDSVKNIFDAENPKVAISMLVSRDTKDMTQSDINKASIETYAENLSDGVIAPMFYLLIFGLWGAFIYKAINTLDSMVGYRNEKYENFGKFSAKLDDIANYIPSRITAILIALLFKSKYALKNFYKYGKLHDSPNAGHPISAMALALNIKLGGPTSYFGKIKDKPYFGEGKEVIEKSDINEALNFKSRFDLLITFIALIYLWNFFL
ncbi:adenosylcobinamide-phosphate synthase CbiB [Arcobacter sp. LA11]|uniref:adenosylcobinamide-phosphate synthase CbiB n=1 Tax=Arcobacter sp. LA11 TaxID=1898176 RepID=UPI00093342DE|nr:adenosylcobinamide-phosphate synthase CbiB [Arcobacter sp. LA11]